MFFTDTQNETRRLNALIAAGAREAARAEPGREPAGKAAIPREADRAPRAEALRATDRSRRAEARERAAKAARAKAAHRPPPRANRCRIPTYR